MKRATDASNPLPPLGAPQPASGIVAVPDTSLTEPVGAGGVASDSLPGLPADSLISRDVRSPQDAGFEDGYADGAEDGASHLERLTHFDDTSVFPSEAERRTYAASYRHGYAAGFDDGRLGRHYAAHPDTLAAAADD